MIGVPNQCEPFEGASQIHYNYLYSKKIKEMCLKIKYWVYQKYIQVRWENACHTEHIVLKKGKINCKFNPTGKFYRNICYLNDTGKKVTDVCCKRFIKENNKEAISSDFSYNNKRETCEVKEEMPILAKQNKKDKDIFNTIEFIIEEIKGDSLKVNDFWFEKDEFTHYFIPALCVTVYKYQGCDINEHYNVYVNEQ